jgi:hypothetical protein
VTTRRMIKSAGKSSYVSVNRGLALLDEAIEQIEFQVGRPGGGDWSQGDWRCGSGMCLAGWVAQLAGAQWAFPAYCRGAEYVVANADDDDRAVINVDGKRVVFVADRADDLLGLDDEEADLLFDAGNSITDIKHLRDRLAKDGLIGD